MTQRGLGYYVGFAVGVAAVFLPFALVTLAWGLSGWVCASYIAAHSVSGVLAAIGWKVRVHRLTTRTLRRVDW